MPSFSPDGGGLSLGPVSTRPLAGQTAFLPPVPPTEPAWLVPPDCWPFCLPCDACPVQFPGVAPVSVAPSVYFENPDAYVVFTYHDDGSLGGTPGDYRNLVVNLCGGMALLPWNDCAGSGYDLTPDLFEPGASVEGLDPGVVAPAYGCGYGAAFSASGITSRWFTVGPFNTGTQTYPGHSPEAFDWGPLGGKIALVLWADVFFTGEGNREPSIQRVATSGYVQFGKDVVAVYLTDAGTFDPLGTNTFTRYWTRGEIGPYWLTGPDAGTYILAGPSSWSAITFSDSLPASITTNPAHWRPGLPPPDYVGIEVCSPEIPYEAGLGAGGDPTNPSTQSGLWVHITDDGMGCDISTVAPNYGAFPVGLFYDKSRETWITDTLSIGGYGLVTVPPGEVSAFVANWNAHHAGFALAGYSAHFSWGFLIITAELTPDGGLTVTAYKAVFADGTFDVDHVTEVCSGSASGIDMTGPNTRCSCTAPAGVVFPTFTMDCTSGCSGSGGGGGNPTGLCYALGSFTMSTEAGGMETCAVSSPTALTQVGTSTIWTGQMPVSLPPGVYPPYGIGLFLFVTLDTSDWSVTLQLECPDHTAFGLTNIAPNAAGPYPPAHYDDTPLSPSPTGCWAGRSFDIGPAAVFACNPGTIP